jgi:hypothetical protein
MKTVDVELTQARATLTGSQNRGDTVPVGLLEAGRMARAGMIKMPDAKTLKAIVAAEKEAGIETAAAAADKAAADKAAADTAAANTGGAA